MHGGDLNVDGSLRRTTECLRLSNEDIEKIMETINTLESNDKEEKAETLEVLDIDDNKR